MFVRMLGRKNVGGKMGVVRRIGKVLRFKAKRPLLFIRLSRFPDFIFHPVGSIELYSGQGSGYFQLSYACPVMSKGRLLQDSRPMVKHEVVVEAAPQFYLPVKRFNPFPEWRKFGEIERRFFYRNNFSCGNAVRRHWRDEVGIELQFLFINI